MIDIAQERLGPFQKALKILRIFSSKICKFLENFFENEFKAKHGMEADVKFEVQDATQIEYPDATFDVIYSR